MDQEIITTFDSVDAPFNMRLGVIANLLQTKDQNISQKAVYALTNPLKELLKIEGWQKKKLNVEYGSVLCEAVARASCSAFITSSDKDASKHFQNSIATILKFTEALTEPTEGVLLALYDIMVNLSGNVQSKHAIQINGIAKKVLIHSDENLALLAGCLLSASIHNAIQFNTLVNSIMLTIQRILNIGYSFVVENGKQTNNHITLIPEEGESIVEIKKGTNFSQIFKVLMFTLARILSNAYDFHITINLESLVGLIRHTLLFDATFLKFRESKSQKLTVHEITGSIPVWHQSTLGLLNAVMTTFKSQLYPFSGHLSHILVQKFKTGQNSYQEMKMVCKSLRVMLATLGTGIAKGVLEETIPILINKVVAMYQMTYDVQQSRESPTAEKKLVLDRKIIQFGVLAIDTLFHIMNSSTTVFLDLVPSLTKLVIAVLQFIPLVDKINDSEMTEMLPDVYRSLRTTLIYSFLVSTSSPFLPTALQLFRKGISSFHSKVQQECFLSLNILENQLHPRSAPLYLPHSETIERYSLKRSLEDFSQESNKKTKFDQEEQVEEKIQDDEEEEDEVDQDEGEDENQDDEQLDDSNVSVNGTVQDDENAEDQEESIVESEIEDDMDQEQVEKTGGIYISTGLYETMRESDIEDDMDEEAVSKSGGIYVTKDILKKVQSLKDSKKKKQIHQESEEEAQKPQKVVEKKQIKKKVQKEIDSDLESIDSDGPDEDKDISSLKLQF